jgi:ketosteroid isomerase-like protein
MTDLEKMIEQYHQSLEDLLQGDPEPAKKLFSHRDDVTLANPFGPAVRGWNKVAETIDRAAAGFRGGGVISFERISKFVTPDLAYMLEVEHLQAKLGGGKDITPFSIRVTSILRLEDGTWKVVHRHADPINSPRTADSMIEK